METAIDCCTRFLQRMSKTDKWTSTMRDANPRFYPLVYHCYIVLSKIRNQSAWLDTLGLPSDPSTFSLFFGPDCWLPPERESEALHARLSACLQPLQHRASGNSSNSNSKRLALSKAFFQACVKEMLQ